MLRFFALSNGRPVKKVDAKNAHRFMSGKNVLWVDVERGTPADFEFVRKTFDVHPLTLEDMRSHQSIPKIDTLQDKYMFIVFHRIYYDKSARRIRTEEIDFCVGKNFVVTVHVPKVESIDELREKMRSAQARVTGPDFVLHQVMDKEVDGYIQLMSDLDDEIEVMEDKLIKGRVGKVLQNLSHHRHEMTVLRRIVGPQREIINALSRGNAPYISERMLLYFRDIFDHIYRFYTRLESHRELVASTFETYMSVQSNSINQVIKQLTIIATIFLPLTFITGVYGMNFDAMPELRFEYGYYLTLAAMAALGIWMWIYFKKRY